MVQKNLLKECRIDFWSVGVFTIFSVLKQSKNNEVFLDFEGSTDRIISQILLWLYLFCVTSRKIYKFLVRAIILTSLFEYFRKKDFWPSLPSRKWNFNIKHRLRIDPKYLWSTKVYLVTFVVYEIISSLEHEY